MDFRITLTGTDRLLMHNSRLVNPIDPIVKAMKKINEKKTKRTDDDFEELARLEFCGSLYHDPHAGPHLPSENIEKCLVDAARLVSKGKDVERGIFFPSAINPLSYVGPRDVDGLWADENFRFVYAAKVTTNRVMRCRPVFRGWSVTAVGELDTSIMSFGRLEEFAVTAGRMIGLGDWRPRYGRFTAEVEKI